MGGNEAKQLALVGRPVTGHALIHVGLKVGHRVLLSLLCVCVCACVQQCVFIHINSVPDGLKRMKLPAFVVQEWFSRCQRPNLFNLLN
jgi:uncharacterized membrane protein